MPIRSKRSLQKVLLIEVRIGQNIKIIKLKRVSRSDLHRSDKLNAPNFPENYIFNAIAHY